MVYLVSQIHVKYTYIFIYSLFPPEQFPSLSAWHVRYHIKPSKEERTLKRQKLKVQHNHIGMFKGHVSKWKETLYKCKAQPQKGNTPTVRIEMSFLIKAGKSRSLSASRNQKKDSLTYHAGVPPISCRSHPNLSVPISTPTCCFKTHYCFVAQLFSFRKFCGFFFLSSHKYNMLQFSKYFHRSFCWVVTFFFFWDFIFK